MTKFPKIYPEQNRRAKIILIISIFFFGIFGLAKFSQAVYPVAARKRLWLFGFLFTFFIIFAGLSITSSAYGATYYVATTGSDSSSGTSAAPFKTIQKAADIVNPGDTVIVKNGNYLDLDGNNRIVEITRSGTASAWITFRSENKWGAVLGPESGYPNTMDDYGFIFSNGASYVKIENFKVYGIARGLHIPNDGHVHHVDIVGNYFLENGWGSIYLGGDNEQNLGHGQYFTVDRNKFEKIGILGTDCRLHHGVYISHDRDTRYVNITNNIFIDCLTGFAVQSAYGGVNAEYINIIGNTVIETKTIGCSGSILFGANSKNSAVQNNIIYSQRPSCIFQYTGSCNTGNKWYNNYCTAPNLWRICGSANDCTSSIDKQNNYCNNSGQCSQSSSDPKFASPSGGDYHLQSSSPAINKGLSANAPSYDFDKVSRPQGSGFDIGAYEYGGGTSDTTAPAAPAGISIK
jgi:hypothetical protein